MALRVLLADESPTIKKAIQLALQDFAVDVMAVNVGVDVLNVTKSFRPDIVFSDVLLQKKNGYDVCAEIKSDPETRHIPVVIMWSGFMELDQEKFDACQANDKVEKPFDVDSLRAMVRGLVPKTQSQTLSNYLSFPEMPTMEESHPTPKEPALKTYIGTPQPSDNNPKTQTSFAEAPPKMTQWNMTHFDPIDSMNPEEVDLHDGFQEVSLQGPQFAEEDEASHWVQSPLSSLSKTTENSPQERPLSLKAEPQNSEPLVDFNSASFPQKEDELQVEEIYEPDEFAGSDTVGDPLLFSRPLSKTLNAQEIEDYIEQACQRRLEEMMTDILPRIAKEVIEKEIKKLINP